MWQRVFIYVCFFTRWREEYDHAIQLHSLQAQAESFLQIIVQVSIS